jgi:hypothetical protein
MKQRYALIILVIHSTLCKAGTTELKHYTGTHNHATQNQNTHSFQILNLPDELILYITQLTISNNISDSTDCQALRAFAQTSKRCNAIVNDTVTTEKYINKSYQKNNLHAPALAEGKIGTQAAKKHFLKRLHACCNQERKRNMSSACSFVWQRDIDQLALTLLYYEKDSAEIDFTNTTPAHNTKYKKIVHNRTNYLTTFLRNIMFFQRPQSTQKKILFYLINIISSCLRVQHQTMATYFVITHQANHSRTGHAYNAAQEYYDTCDQLHGSVENESMAVLLHALGTGINPNATQDKDPTHITPLMKAIDLGYKDINFTLLAAGANPDCVDVHNNTALMVAACHHCNTHIMETLIEHTANIDVCNEHNASPLWFASQNGNFDIVKMLIQRGACINRQHNHHGVTPLFIAIETNHTSIIHYLLEQPNIDVNVATHHNRTPLMRAIEHEELGVIHALLKKGADKQVVHEAGHTAQSFARKTGNQAIINMLQ